MILGHALGVSATRIEAHVLGEHPRSPLLIFSSIKVDGQLFTVDERVKNKVREELANYLGSFEALKGGRSSGWTSASGIVAIVRAIVENLGELLDCSAVIDEEYNYKGLSLGVPAIIGKEGIRQIIELNLAAHECRELDIIAGVLQDNSRLVHRLIDSKRI
jgi:malate/lactate dehydrogenase